MCDLAGNDIGYAVRTSLGLTDPSGRDPSVEYSADVADELARAGRFGQKVGKGWYFRRVETTGSRRRRGRGADTPSRCVAATLRRRVAATLPRRRGRTKGTGARPRYLYETPRVPSPDPDVDSLIAGFKDASLAQTVSADDVRDRAMLALANEGFRVLEERLALRPSDIDVVWTSGYGFPRHVGGPMHWAEARGLAEVRDRLVGFAAERPSVPYLQPAKLLADMADVGAPLKDWEKFL